MIKTIRAWSPVLLAALFILISASFLVFYNIPQLEQLRGGHLGRIDGREITTEQFRLAQQAAEEISRLAYGRDISTTRGNLLIKMTWERLVLLNEAKKLGIIVTDKEAANFIMQLPFLQKEGKFDNDRYQQFLKNYLPIRGLTEDHFEQIAREEVSLDKVREAILSPAQISQGDLTSVLNEFFGPLKISLVRWQRADFLKEVKVTPDDLDKEYKNNASNPAYRTLERRKVSFVSFLLTPDQMKLADAPKAAAKRAMGEKATDFAVTVVDKITSQPDAWDSLAKEKGVSSVITDYFAKDEAPKDLPPSTAFNRTAYQLNKDAPISDAVEIDNGYVVIRLLDVQESQLRPLDEVRSIVEQNVREQGAVDVLRQHGQEVATSLKTEMAKGKAFDEVARDLKLNVESPPAFTAWQVPPTLKDGDIIVDAIHELQAGQLTSFAPTPSGGLVIFLESRAASDNALANTMKPRVQVQLLQQRREQLMEEWFRTRMQRPDISMPQMLSEK